jgi:hypothetical protein
LTRRLIEEAEKARHLLGALDTFMSLRTPVRDLVCQRIAKLGMAITEASRLQLPSPDCREAVEYDIFARPEED